MGACLLAIGMFVSAMTENQIIAAILSFVVMLVIFYSDSIAGMISATSTASFFALAVMALILGIIVYVMVKNYIVALATVAVLEISLATLFNINSSLFEGLFGKVIGWLSIYERCANFYNGIFDLTAIVYFLSVIFLFVFLSVQAVEKRRWS